MRTKALLIAIATILTVGSAGVWFLICENQEAQERRAKFFGSKEYPTSGGEKMKVGW